MKEFKSLTNWAVVALAAAAGATHEPAMLIL